MDSSKSDKGAEKLLEIFAQEGLQKLEELDAYLLQLEKDPTSDEINKQCLGLTHSLKGASGAVGATLYADISHVLEEIFQGLQRGTLQATGELFDDLFGSLDCMRANTASIGDKESDEQLALHHQRLQNWGKTSSVESGEISAPGGSSDFELGEYDHARLRAIERQKKHLCRVDVLLDDASCFLKLVEEILGRLRKVDDVVATEPQIAALESLEELKLFQILLGSTKTPDEVEEFLRQGAQEGVSFSVSHWESESKAIKEVIVKKTKSTQTTSVQPWLKVGLERVDNLVDMVGELVIIESMVINAPEISGIENRQVTNNLSQMTRITRDLQDVVMRMRMVPLDGLFSGMERAVRDLSRKTNKQVLFKSQGSAVEMDRNLIERIRDPLLHLIRNSVDHGIEEADERKSQGKASVATITLSASHQGGNIVLCLEDDGGGIDTERVKDIARQKGWLVDGHEPSETEVFSYLFRPGFSTSAQVTEVSGRGVGLDVVRRTVEEMRGRVTVSSASSKGTTFELILPLTLAIIDGMLTRCGGDEYIIPTLSVVESIQPTKDTLVTHQGDREVINVRGELIPLMRLSRLFDTEDAISIAEEAIAVVVESAGRKAALLVDEVVSQQQVVIKTIAGGVGRTEFFSGAAILPDGSVGLILNVDEIVESAGARLYSRSLKASSDRSRGESQNLTKTKNINTRELSP